MRTPSRYAFLDALRGIAALLVVWAHASERILLRWPAAAEEGTVLADVARTLNFGSMGVVCFFLISGFVIPFSLARPIPGAADRRESRPGGLRAFVLRRFFRLYPAYWLSIAGVLAVGFGVGSAFPPVRQVAANLTMASGFFGEAHLVGMYWTLQMELVFYVLCGLLYRFGWIGSGRVSFGLSVAFLLVFAALLGLLRAGALGEIDPDFVYLPFILSCMFLGSLFRHAWDAGIRGREGLRLGLAAVIWLSLPGALLALAAMGRPLSGDAVLGGNTLRFGTGHALGFFLFVAGCAFLQRAPRLLAGLGLVSYSLYLFHGIGIDLTVWVVEDWNLPGAQGRSLGFYLSLMIVAGIALAALSYRLVEKPSIALGRGVSSRMLKKDPKTPA